MAIISASVGTKDILLPSAAHAPCASIAGATLSCWASFNATPAASGTCLFFATNAGGTARRLALLGQNVGGLNKIRGTARRLDTDGVISINGATTLTTDTAYFLLTTADFNQNGTQALTVYLNGVQDGQTTIPSWTGNLDAAACGGASIGSQGGTAYADATIDDVRFWTRVLTQAEISSLYAARGRDSILSGLSFRYPLNEAGSGAASGAANIVDRINLANATQQNGPTYTSALAYPHR